MEAALVRLKNIPKGAGKPEIYVKTAERLSQIIGLIVPTAGDGKSIDTNTCLRFYEAGLLERGDKELRSSFIQWAKANKRLYFRICLGHTEEWDDQLKGYYPSKYRIISLKYYGGGIPDNIVGNLAVVPKELRKLLYIAVQQKDPILLLRIPEKNFDHRTYFCVEILRWE